MKKFHLPISLLIVVVCALGFASVAQAQASRTWVSGVGDDANPCSRTAPCKTFAGAISKTAPSGEINALDDGGFGAVTITKSITIEGGGHIAGVLVSGTNGINISAGPNDTVTLRNLDIDGLGSGLTGISINSAKNVHIDNCQIYGFTNRAISDARVSASSPTARLFVNDCFIRNNANGIGVTGAAAIKAFIRNCRIQNNTGFGVLGSNSSAVALESSIVTANGGDGFKVDTSAQGSVIGCRLIGNASGVISVAGSNVFLADNSIFNNSTGVSGAVVTFGNNNVTNNVAGNALPAATAQQ